MPQQRKMSTVAAYRRALERLYTLIGKEYGLVVVAVNPEWTNSNAAARELLLVARSISTEARADSCTKQIIQGPVVRYDLLTAAEGSVEKRGVNDVVELKIADIQAAFAGRSLPLGTPLIVALVGVGEVVIRKLADCTERSELARIVTGGYAVLTYTPVESGPPMRLSYTSLCEEKPRDTPVDKLKFLLGSEVISSDRTLSYAIRIQSAPLPPVQRAEPASMREPVRVIRAPRWKKQEPPAPPAAAPVVTPDWEKLVQEKVEEQLKKILAGKDEPVTVELGDGLLARAWPDVIHKLSEARDWTAVFTHQSLNPTPRANYEAFETLGDKVLSLSLVHYLFSDTARALDSNGLTDSHKEILSSVKQTAMAVSMGLGQRGLIRSSVTVDDKMLEDVYEAFFGCLFTVANRMMEGGNQGLPLCEALFKQVLHETFPSLDPWSVPKDPQTTLDQIFIRMGWGHPLLSYNEDTRITMIRLTRDAHAYLESVGPPIKMDKPLVIGPRAADKPSSARAAAEVALSALKLGWGIDSRYASIIVRTRLMKDERYAAVQREALRIAERMGYVDIYVARRAKNHNQLYAVMGVKRDDSEVQLHVYKYENSESREPEAMSTRVAAYITALRGFITSTAAVSARPAS